ncbi:MAG: hypothetical protein AMXMBFR53_19780 [Gemmatimonadota bacterium]
MAVLAHSVELVCNEPGLDRSRLLKTIQAHPSFRGFRPKPEKPAVLVFHNLGFVSGVHAALIALKSMLDLYSRLITRLLVPTSTLFGFNKTPFRGRKRPGGRLLNWIENSAPDSFDQGPVLVATLVEHLDLWLEEAVDQRDAIIHDGGIPGLVEAMVPLVGHPNELDEAAILLPTMPGGEAVTDYCQRLVHNARILISQTLPLLPEVDLSLLKLYEGAVLRGRMNDASV